MGKRESDEARWARLVERRHWTVEDAKWVMAAWRASGKPSSVFAAERGIEEERMRRWRSRLNSGPGRPSLRPVTTAEGGRPVMPQPQTTLVPVSVRPSASVASGDMGAVVVSAGPVQIAVRDPGATSPEWVARLIGRLAAESGR
jgi:hypothetical protein